MAEDLGPRRIRRGWFPAPEELSPVHVFGPTAMPPFVMPHFYRDLANRVAGTEAVTYHPMGEVAGFGRTDRIADSYRPIMEAAGERGLRLRIVGHSLGGIVAWVLAHDYPEVIEYAEVWAAPLRGTSLAPASIPLAECRFLSRESRFLKRYDRPIDGPFVRAVLTPNDTLARPAMEVCTVEGPTTENHVISSRPLPAHLHRPNLFVHRGTARHAAMPRKSWLQEALAVHDRRLGLRWARPAADAPANPADPATAAGFGDIATATG